MGFEPKRAPNPADGRLAHAQLLRHQARTPMGGRFRLGLERQLDDLLDLFITDLARGAGTRFIPKGIHPALTEPPPPIADRGVGGSQGGGHRTVLLAGGTPENNARPKDQGPMPSLFNDQFQFLPLRPRDHPWMFLGPAAGFFVCHADMVPARPIYTSYF